MLLKLKNILSIGGFFLPLSISLLAVAIIFLSLTSSRLIKEVNKEKQLAEVKGEKILKISPSPTLTITPTPTVEIKREQTVYKQPVEQYVVPTAIPTPTPYLMNQQSVSQQVQMNTNSNNNPVPTAPRDSQGIPCWGTASHCKYECKDPDGMIDAWVDNIKFYVDRSNFTTDEEKLQEYKNEINDRVAKLTTSCGEAKVRQWVQ